MIRAAFVACWVLAAVGCGDDSASRDAGAGAPEMGVSLTGILYEYQPGSDTSVAGVKVCLPEPRRCVMSNQDGRFVIDRLDPGSEIVLTFFKAGYVPTLLAVVTPSWSSTLGISYLTRSEDLGRLRTRLQGLGRSESDDSDLLPLISFSAPGGLTSNVRVRLDPDPGTDPFYILDSGELTLGLPVGSRASFGEYVDLPPREDYELVYEHANGVCNYYPSALGGWPAKSGRSNATRIPVRDGFMTYTSLEDCSLDLATPDDASVP